MSAMRYLFRRVNLGLFICLLVGTALCAFVPAKQASAEDLVTLSGFVRMPSGNLLGDIKVVAVRTDQSAPDVSTLTVGESLTLTPNVHPGSYELNLAPGTYDIRAERRQMSIGWPPTTTTVTLSGDTTLDLTYGPQGSGTTGTVTDSNGNPAPNIWVKSGGYFLSTFAVTDQAGHYSLPTVNNHFALFNTDQRTDFPSQIYTQFFNLTASAVMDYQLPPTVTVDVLVKDSQNNPWPNQILRIDGLGDISPSMTRQEGVAATDATGHATFKVMQGLGLEHLCLQMPIRHWDQDEYALQNCVSPADAGLSDLSEDRATTFTPYLPPAPTGLSTTVPTSAPVLSWDAVPEATTYKVYRDGVGIGSALSYNPTFTDITAQPGHTYTYAVLAGRPNPTTSGTPTYAAYSFLSDPITVTVVPDTFGPTITFKQNPAANSAGWNNTSLGVNVTCYDPHGTVSCGDSSSFFDEGANQSLTASSTDTFGNTTTQTFSGINIDLTAPAISYTTSAAPNSAGWNNQDVTVTFQCSDALSGVDTCTAPVLVAEGANQQIAGTAVDRAGNSAHATASLNIDKTAPTLGLQSWANNPKNLSQTAVVTVPATDNLSGVSSGEYFIGSTDPGQGNGTVMDWDGANLTASFASLAIGRYQINVRAKDAAGNWSAVESSDLVVFDATGPTDVAGSKQVVPQLGSGDTLPGLISGSQNDKANVAFDVAYNSTGAISNISFLTLEYSTGKGCNSPHPTNCHTTNFTVNSTAPNVFNWLTIAGAGSSVGTFQGQGTLTIDGTATNNPFKVQATDGDRTSPATSDDVQVYIYSPGANPDSATPLYQLHVHTAGNWLKIQ